MVKTIRKTIQITTRKRNNSIKINEEFYSYDKKNAQFEFLMDYDVPADKVIALFHFENSNRYYETLCQFKGNLITIDFDTTLIVEDELVTGYLYFDKLDKSTDVYRFTFGVRVSEIDKTRELPVQEKVSRRIVPVADIVTKQELQALMDKIRQNGGTYDDSEIRQLLAAKTSSIEERLTVLETSGAYNDQPLLEKIKAVEERFNNLSNIYLTSHQSLEHLATNDALNKIEQRVQQLEQNRDFITRQELESKHYLTSVPEEYAKKTDLYNDSELRNKITQLETNSVTKDKVESVENRVQILENKSVVTHEELESAGYAKTTDLTNFAANSKVEAVESRVLALENKPAVIPQGYDDSALSGRVSALEAKQDNDTVYNDTEIKQRLTNLENRPQVDLTDYAKKSEIPNTTNFATTDSVNNLLRTQGEQATKISALESKSAYEIHGTGMPNGQVSAPIGTTYVDMNVTNGALKWIKHSGNGNTGWKVLIGDTGWRTLNSVSKLKIGDKSSFIKIRRVNNLVTYQFGGLQWGWFGVGRRNGPDFVRHNSSGDKGAKVLRPGGIPTGFRSEASLIGGIYNDAGKPYGIWYLGGATDSNFIQFTFNDPIPTDKDIGDIRVSAVSYTTDEDWPTTLP